MKNKSKANKGMNFEAQIDLANNWYFDKGIAAIVKIPTSIKLERRYNPLKKISEIAGAYPEKKSTVDYTGQFYNVPIWIEAKSTSNKTSFPIKNIKDHQMEWLKVTSQLHAHSLILIEVVQERAVYRMSYKQLEAFIKNHDRKSIPFSFFKQHCHKVTFNQYAVLDYLKGLNF